MQTAQTDFQIVTFLIVTVIVLFLVVLGFGFYILKTSGAREHRLLGLLESYAVQLNAIAQSLQEMARNVADITRRLERMETRDYSNVRGINNSGTMTVGQDMVGGTKS